MARVTKTDLRRALQHHGGVIAKVAEAYAVTRQTVYNWIDRYELRDLVESSRTMMFDLAADNVYQAVEKGDFEASKFVLTHMPTAGRWSNRTEVTGKDGAPLGMSADVLELMRQMGLEPSDVVRQFEEMVRNQAAAVGER